MNVIDILNDENRRRQEFPVCERSVFLAHAGVSPLPCRVADAIQQYVEAASRGDQEDALPERIVAETRQRAAKLIEANPDEIAFVGSTSMGLAMVAAGLDWRAGDAVICYRADYPANVYPWMDLESRGVEVRFVQPRQYGRITVNDLEPLVDKRTRLVSLASVHFVTGWRLDVDEIGRFLRERGVLFCLDGIQSFGALKTSMRFVDFAAADAHKWLLGPLGTAIFYVRREHLGRLRPVLVGWNTAFCPDYIAQPVLKLRPDARRYEPGSLNLAGIVGLNAALEMILEIGIDRVEELVLERARDAIKLAEGAGCELLGPREGEELSGIVSMTCKNVEAIHSRLGAAGIVTSLRRRHENGACLRVSAHFYNTKQDVEKLQLDL
jgi:selenocysteine lyase/cysteine desulfurase